MSLAAVPPLIEDEPGIVVSPRRERRSRVLASVAAAGTTGMTWREVGDALGINHGAASGALSVLQDNGQLTRLRTRRGGCGVYVLPQYADPTDIALRRRPAISQAAVDAAYQDGLSRGRDDGWTTGYDAAMRDVTVGADMHRRAGADALRTQLLQIIGALQREVDPIGAASVHSKTCWRQHPVCAVRAVKRAVENIDVDNISVNKKSPRGYR